MNKRVMVFGVLMLGHMSIIAGPNEDLIRAVEKGSVELAKKALKQKANANTICQKPKDIIRNCGEGSVLACAADRGNADMVRLLLGYGATVDLPESSTGATPLLLASYRGHLLVARVLIENKADVNTVNQMNEHPLKAAAQSGNAKLVKLLIDTGADVNAINVTGTTALMWSNLESMKLLVEAKADVNIKDSEGKPIIQNVINEFTIDPREAIIKLRLLIAAGADISHNSKEGKGLIKQLMELSPEGISAQLYNMTPVEAKEIRDQAVQLLRQAGAPE